MKKFISIILALVFFAVGTNAQTDATKKITDLKQSVDESPSNVAQQKRVYKPYLPSNAKGVLLDESFETWPPTDWGFFELGDQIASWQQTTSQAHTGSNSAYHNDDDGSAVCEDWMVTPALVIDNALYSLNFWEYLLFGGNYYIQHKVSVLDGPDPSTANELEVLYDAAGAGPWEEQTFSLAAYNGQTIYIGFYYEGDYADEWAIDDVTVSSPVSNDAGISSEPIAYPFYVTGSTIDVKADITNFGALDLTSATIKWTIDDGNGLVAQTDVPWTGTLTTGSTETDVTLGSFTANEATYTINVWTELPNGVADENVTNDAFASSITGLDAYPIPFVDGFEAQPDNMGWFALDEDNDDVEWYFIDNTGLSRTGTVSLYDWTYEGENDWIISPPITLSAGEDGIKFWARQQADGYTNNLQLMISTTTPEIANFTQVANFTINDANYNEYMASLPQTGTVYLAFYINDASGGAGVAIDDLEVYTPVDNDMAVKYLTIPVSGCGLTNSEEIGFDAINHGLDVKSSFDARYSLDNGATWSAFQTFTPTSPLGFADFETFAFTGIDFSAGGIYDVIVDLEADENLDNNQDVGNAVSVEAISNFYFLENFESGVLSNFVLEDATESGISIVDNNSSKVLRFEGHSAAGSWVGTSGGTTATQAWVDNAAHHASAYTCNVDATALTTMKLSFDLRQTYTYGPLYTWFRVLVDGNPIADMNGNENFNPITNNSDPYTNIAYDLSAFAGTEFVLTFQSSAKYKAGYNGMEGDISYVDNIFIDEIRQHDLSVNNVTPSTGVVNGYVRPEIKINNFGEETETTFDVTVTVDNYTSTETFENLTLEGGETMTVVMTDAWIPTAMGDFDMTATVSVADDENAANNTLTKEVAISVSAPQNLTGVANADYGFDLSWQMLPDGELKYDDNTAEGGMMVGSPSSLDHMFYTKYVAPVDGNLTNIAVLHYSSGVASWEKAMVCLDDGTGKPDLNNPIESFPGIEVNSSVYNWWILPLTTPYSITAGDVFYIVTQWSAGNTAGPYVARDNNTQLLMSAWTSTGGDSWNIWAGATWMMRAYINENVKGETYVLKSGDMLDEMTEMPVANSVIDQNSTEEASKSTSVSVPMIYTENSDAATSYTINRGTESGTYNEAFTGVTETNYTDAGLTPDTEYFYAVSATYPEGVSENSYEISVTTLSAPVAPTNPVPADAATDQPRDLELITWTNNGNVTLVDVYMSLTENDVINNEATAKVVDNVAVTDSYIPTDILAEGTWYWKVVCKDNITKTEAEGAVWNFTVTDVVKPVIAYESIMNTSLLTNLEFSDVEITDVSGINVTAGTAPRIYYKKSTDANNYVGNASTDDGWKYVEANGTTSPFDFTIDYSLINGGTVAVDDEIEYFVVAQDLSAAVNFDIEAGSLALTPISVALTTAEFPVAGTNSYTIVPLLSSPITVGTAGDYTSLTADGGFFEAINGSSIDGDMVVTITSDLTLEDGTHTLNQVAEQGADAGTYTITIQDDGSPWTISGSNNPLIVIDGTNRVTITGGADDNTRNLTFQNNADGEVLQINSGSTDITITNCNIIGFSKTSSFNYGIKALGADIDGVNILNNVITKVQYGISAKGTSSSDLLNLNIVSNMIGSDVEDDYIGKYGIDVRYIDGALVQNNEVKNIVGSSGYGAKFNEIINVECSGNNIHDIIYTGSGGYGSAGLWFVLDEDNPNILVYNNVIRHITGDSDVPGSTSNNYNPVGIRLSGAATSGMEILHNSIYMTPDADYGLNYSDDPVYYGALTIGANISGIDMRNNIFRASLGENTACTQASIGYAVWYKGSANPFATIDNNTYFADNQDENYLARVGDSNKDLAAWQSFTGQDANSYFQDPLFISETDLMVDCGSPAIIGGQPTDINNDFVSNLRNPETPTSGAYEAASFTSEHTNNTSCQTPDGTITITGWGIAIGDTYAKTYTINGTDFVDNGGLFTGVSAGTYNAGMICDGCELVSTDAILITEPSSIVIDNIAVADVSGCYGGANGTITVTISGGSGVDTEYSIDAGSTYQSSNLFENLVAGDAYVVAVTDNAGCTTIETTLTVITEPTELLITNEVSVNIEDCFGDDDGSITITASGGTGAIEYSIDNGAVYQATGTFANLASADYTIIVKDASSCETSGSTITITEPTELIISAENYVDVTCPGDEDGEITITAAGGTGALEYSIDGGVFIANGGEFTGLAEGDYTVRVKDENTCIIEGGSETITSTENPIAAFTHSLEAGGTVVFANTSTDATTFAWDFGDGTGTSADENPTYQFAANDSYDVVLTSSSVNCDSEFTETVSIINVGINTITHENVEVYPNPTNGIVNIEYANEAKINVYNLLGELVLSNIDVNGFTEVDMSELTNGTYIIKISTDDNVITTKINLIK